MLGVGIYVGYGSSLFNFLSIHLCPPTLVRFFLADQRGMAYFPKSVRFELPHVIENLKLLLWEGKKQNVQILTNRGYKIVVR